MYVLLFGLGLLLLLTLFEQRMPAQEGPGHRWFNVGTGLMLMASQLVAAPVLLNVLKVPPLLDGAAMPFWLGLVLFVITMDAAEYAFHRAQHAIPILWRMHEIHHSDENMNATTAQRHFWGDPIMKALTIWPLQAAIVKPTPEIVVTFVLISSWHTVVHSNLKLDFGSWSWLLNSPAYHRRHHSADPAHHNSNFSALFPIFDVITGAYRRPDGYPATGLPQVPRNLLQVATWPLRSASGDKDGDEQEARGERPSEQLQVV
jgi:sterol desaturase/sphingolipid hydroxylase (fatty acid hydroxylase superfamily)